MEEIKVALDTLGGDNAPEEIVKGAVDALRRNARLKVALVGPKEQIEPLLTEASDVAERTELVDAREKIEMAEHPVSAIRTKRDSSMVRGLMMVKSGEADAFISAGNSGAVLAGGQLLVGRIRGIERPPFAPIIPTAKGPAILIDCGANVDARSSWLVQFAQMGTIYMREIMGIEKPRVALVNIGAEEEKGNALVKETMPLLRELPGINFIGSIEARDIPEGYADVIVCDAFVGNVILKLYEGVASTLLREVKGAMTASPLTTLGAALVKGSLKKTLKRFDAKAYGGAPMLGLTGLVVKCHGNAMAGEIANALDQCVQWKDVSLNEHFRTEMDLPERRAVKAE